MMTMRSLWRAAGRHALFLGTALALPVWAVGDLKGGPAVNQFNLHPPASAIAADQQWLHNFMLVICTVIFLAVFGVMFYSMFMHRKSRGAKSANFHESVGVEIAWTLVPFLIVTVMGLAATRTAHATGPRARAARTRDASALVAPPAARRVQNAGK